MLPEARTRVCRLPLLLPVIGLMLVCGACWRGHGAEEAFVAERNVTLWTSLAQVRQPAASLHYGDRVEVVARQNEQIRVRTVTGAEGWTDQRNLMDSALWHRARDLGHNALAMQVQARGTNDKLTNVHIEPARNSPRTYQLRAGTPLEVLGRATADFTRGGPDEGAAPGSGGTAEAKHEDWALIRAHDEPAGDLAGWVLRRFLKYEIPHELVDYSTQYRFVAWFELGRVPTGTPTAEQEGGGQQTTRGAPGPPQSARGLAAPLEKPQFLVAGILGPEGQSCDFTLLRAYTWGAQRRRYETAFVESKLCGSLPIVVRPASAGANATFAFTNLGRAGKEQREYSMYQTSIRRTDNRRPMIHKP